MAVRHAATIALALTLTALTACAGRRDIYVYANPAAGPDDLTRDITLCRNAAVSYRHLIVFRKFDRAEFRRCMERRGYSITIDR